MDWNLADQLYFLSKLEHSILDNIHQKIRENAGNLQASIAATDYSDVLFRNCAKRLQHHPMGTESVCGRKSITHIVGQHLAHQIRSTSLVRRSLILERAATSMWFALSLICPR
ncbi:hypothetical protein [Parasphingorhabdus marina]|uniref:hypothetical protein n=1 Tax=Parasphingorhabdus marina TaxID=394732 RepID=UPI0011610FCF|nr:hypothetical protein [Parasphingorhabdus marina]